MTGVNDHGPSRAPELTLAVALPPELLEQLVELSAERALVQLRGELETAGPSPYMTAEEAAAFLRCKRQRVYELHSSGRLPGCREGGRLLFLRADVERLIVAAYAAA